MPIHSSVPAYSLIMSKIERNLLLLLKGSTLLSCIFCTVIGRGGYLVRLCPIALLFTLSFLLITFIYVVINGAQNNVVFDFWSICWGLDCGGGCQQVWFILMCLRLDSFTNTLCTFLLIIKILVNCHFDHTLVLLWVVFGFGDSNCVQYFIESIHMSLHK